MCVRAHCGSTSEVGRLQVARFNNSNNNSSNSVLFSHVTLQTIVHDPICGKCTTECVGLHLQEVFWET